MFRTAIETLLNSLASGIARRQAKRELAGLSDHLLADAGILRSEIPTLLERAEMAEMDRRHAMAGRTGPSTRLPPMFNRDLLPSCYGGGAVRLWVVAPRLARDLFPCTEQEGSSPTAPTTYRPPFGQASAERSPSRNSETCSWTMESPGW